MSHEKIAEDGAFSVLAIVEGGLVVGFHLASGARGTVEQAIDEWLFARTVRRAEPCDHCGGDGRDYDPVERGTVPCLVCDGSGKKGGG